MAIRDNISFYIQKMCFLKAKLNSAQIFYYKNCQRLKNENDEFKIIFKDSFDLIFFLSAFEPLFYTWALFFGFQNVSVSFLSPLPKSLFCVSRFFLYPFPRPKVLGSFGHGNERWSGCLYLFTKVQPGVACRSGLPCPCY